MSGAIPWPDEQGRDEKGRPLFCVGPDCTRQIAYLTDRSPGRKYCSIKWGTRARAVRLGRPVSGSPGGGR